MIWEEYWLMIEKTFVVREASIFWDNQKFNTFFPGRVSSWRHFICRIYLSAVKYIFSVKSYWKGIWHFVWLACFPGDPWLWPRVFGRHSLSPGILTSRLSEEQFQNSIQAECGHPFRLTGQSTAIRVFHAWTESAESERNAVVCKLCQSWALLGQASETHVAWSRCHPAALPVCGRSSWTCWVRRGGWEVQVLGSGDGRSWDGKVCEVRVAQRSVSHSAWLIH